MKQIKFFLAILCLLFLFSSCKRTVTTSSDKHLDFKIGVKGFEKVLKKDFDFQKLSVGTYFTKKNLLNEEKGVNLTFQKEDISRISDSVFNVYSEVIKNRVKKYLLHLDNYDYVVITFENKDIKEELTKSTSIKIKKSLKK